MASGPRQERVVHQDYLARIRYSNALPPPPVPPKLLDIPGTGLAGGDYTSASYASRLIKEQPLNIEADAELGMPIDLIGVPGIFNGDDRAVLARPGNPKLHPTDKALTKPLSSLGRSGANPNTVSFLRRTEYTSQQNPQQFTSITGKDLPRYRNSHKPRNIGREDPLNIIRDIIKGFDVAYPADAYKGAENTTSIRGSNATANERRAWTNPRHPSNPNLTLLDTYPVLPDLDALPSTACYVVAKFINNPVAAGPVYDVRLDAAILQPKDDPAKEAAFQQKIADWDQTSARPEPLREFDYDYFLPLETSSVRGIKRKLDVNDPDRDDPNLYTHAVSADDPDARAFKYNRIRTYETYNQQGNPNNFYNDSVALALHDPDSHDAARPDGPPTSRLSKGAYFYPIIQRSALRPRRNVGVYPMVQSQAVEEDKIDEINLTVGELDEDSKAVVWDKVVAMDPSLKAHSGATAGGDEELDGDA